MASSINSHQHMMGPASWLGPTLKFGVENAVPLRSRGNMCRKLGDV